MPNPDPNLVVTAAIRLVLVHLLAHFSDILHSISEGADKDITKFADAGDIEFWMSHYRDEVDQILARAAQIGAERRSAA